MKLVPLGQSFREVINFELIATKRWVGDTVGEEKELHGVRTLDIRREAQVASFAFIKEAGSFQNLVPHFIALRLQIFFVVRIG